MAEPNRIDETRRAFLAALRADRAIYLVIAGFAAIGLSLMAATATLDRAAYLIYLPMAIVVFALYFPAMAVLYEMVRVMHRFDRRRRLAYRKVFAPDRLGRMLAGSLLGFALMAFQGTFTSLKNALPVWAGGFPYDRAQADLDRVLHFGVDPWRYLEPLIASPTMLRAIEANYNLLWFVICFATLYFIVASPRADAVRTRYLIAWMATWVVLGNVMAGMWLSAGPAFYGEVTGDTQRFSELLGHLAANAGNRHSAITYQTYLWSLFEAGKVGFGSGISAFPSVHVGLITLNALFAFDLDRRLGAVMAAYVATVMASSVALGWHYAIDGYVSVAVVMALHHALKRAFAAGAPALAPVTAS